MSFRVILFDIDGTLVHAGGAGRRALARAFGDLWGMIPRFDFSLAGLTDSAIMRRLVKACGKSDAFYEENRERLFARYVDFLIEEMGTGAGGRVYPGVPELLRALAARPGVVTGLLTGNLEGGARAKLAPFGLMRFFSVGGYGSDAEDRAEIYDVVMRRLPPEVRAASPDVSVVGDTPHDVRVARARGARAVGVATGGHYALRDLADAGADHLFADLADTARVMAALGVL